MLDYFKSYVDDVGQIYSLDMIRLNFDLGENVEAFVKFLTTFHLIEMALTVKHYPSFAQFKYRDMWDCIDEESDARWAIGLNLGRNADDKSKGFIEFNPNKCESSYLFQKFFYEFKSMTVTRELVRYDLAIDIPLPRNLFRLIRDGNRLYDMKIKQYGVTEYLGVRSNDGFVKLYDKEAESKLNEDLTRLEITLAKGTSLSTVFPEVWVMDSQSSLRLDDGYYALSNTQRVLADLLRDCDNPNMYWQRLDGHTRKKIAPYVASKVLGYDKKCAVSVQLLAESYE